MSLNLHDLTEQIYQKTQDPQLDQLLFHQNHSQAFQEHLKEVIDQESQALSEGDHQRLENEFFQYGPLENLFSEDEITEILFVSWKELWVEVEGKLSRRPAFLSPHTYSKIFLQICEEAGLQLSHDVPFGDGQWRDFRIHATRPPISSHQTMTLRRQSYQNRSLSWFIDRETLTCEQDEVLLKLLKQRKNILFVGSTGSGKTSLLNALLKETPENERTVILEDTDELSTPNEASTKLLTRFDSSQSLRPIELSELVKQALRMRPDRLVLGEVRGPEAKDLLMALATGHNGSLGTLHADSAKQALLRLEMLVQLGAPQWQISAIRTLIHLSVDAIVVLQKESGHRFVEGIYRVAGLESFGLLTEKIG